MKKFLFAVVSLMLAGCSNTPEERAKDLVTEYIKAVAKDPSSVQDVDLFSLIDKPEKDLHGNVVHYWYTTVTYRARNASGALVKSDYITVKFDSDVKQILCFDCFR